MKNLYTTLSLFIGMIMYGQDGTLDTTFGMSGKIDYSIFLSFVDMQMDFANNKIVAIGKSTAGLPILVRYNLDGTYDTTFDGDGIKEINFGSTDETPISLCVYENSINGSGYLVASSLFGKIAKIKTAGTFDATFGTNGIYSYNTFIYDNFHTVVLNYENTSGNIVFASHDTQIFSTRVNLYKINPTGGNVSTFNSGSPVGFYIFSGQEIAPNSINTDDNGNIYISGPMSIAGGFDTTVRKFSANGIVDSSYLAQSGGANSRSFAYPGFIFDSGDNTSYAYGMDQNYKMLISKKTATGAADATFGTNSNATIDFTDTYYDNIKSITGHEDGNSFKIILAGRTRVQSTTSMANISITRINANGALDTTFGTTGKVSVPTLLSTYTGTLASAIDYNNGKLYVMGFSATGIVSLYRFNLDSLLSSNDNNLTDDKITLFPNPSTNLLMLQTDEVIQSIKIVDILGRNSVINNFKNNQIDVSVLADGMYFIIIKTENGIFKQKFIKQ